MSSLSVSPTPFHATPAPQIAKSNRAFHQKIHSNHDRVLVAWENLKSKFVKKDQITLLLEKGDFENPEEIASYFLTINPFSYNGYLLRQYIKTADADFVKELFEEVLNQYFENGNFQFEKILPFFDADKLEELTDEDDLADKLAEMAKHLPDDIEIKTSIPKQIHKTLRVVWRFFPNFLDTALRAFNLVEAGKNPETIWDFATMFEIYYKMFLIPHGIFLIVSAIVAVPLQAILISAAVVLALVIGLCIYIKYRPLPNKLPRSENFTEKAMNGEFDPVVSRDREIELISSYLGKKEDRLSTNLLLVGEPGVGKTELIKGIAQQYREKTIFGLSAPVLASGFSPILDVLRLILVDIKGHENEVIFFIDELGDAIKKNPSANIGGYLKPLLGGQGVQVIAAVTKKEYEEQILTDDALASRFLKIDIEPTNENETTAILETRMETKGKNVRFEDNTAWTIYDLTKEKLQPRQAVQLIDLAINKVNAFDITKYVSGELLKARTEYTQKQKQYERACNRKLKSASELAGELDELTEKLKDLEDANAECISSALKVKTLIKQQRDLFRKRNQLAKKQPLDNKELLYLNWVLLPWMDKKISSVVDELPEDIPMEINKKLIQSILAR